jgi:uncharacterized membrane protein YedE/YeeE
VALWAWWLSGLSLATIAVLNWLVVGRMLAVSGRFTAIVDRVRSPAKEPAMSQDELLAAIRAATSAEFGDAAVSAEPPPAAPVPAVAPARSPLAHFVFFACLVAGGALASALAGAQPAHLALRSEAFSRLFGEAPWATPLVLVFGGALVGFGTRMASGCTSGHGLCGVSRGQRGSLLATGAFFGAGVLVSFLLEALR